MAQDLKLGAFMVILIIFRPTVLNIKSFAATEVMTFRGNNSVTLTQ